MSGRGIGRGRGKTTPIDETTVRSPSSGIFTGPPTTPISEPSSSSGRGTRVPSGRAVTRFLAVSSSRASVESPSSSTTYNEPEDGNASEINKILCEEVQKCILAPAGGVMAKRPTERIVDVGNSGQPIKVRTNCIKLQYNSTGGVHQYHVTITPDVDLKRNRYKLVWLALPKKKGIRCFDGGSLLYLPSSAPQLVTQVELDGIYYQVKLVLTKILKIDECTALFGTLIRNCCKALGLKLVGRHHFDLEQTCDITKYGLRIWSGFVSAVEEKEDGVYLTLDTVCRVLRTETGYDALKKIQDSNPTNFQSTAIKMLAGTSVITHYNNRMYRIDDILWSGSPAKTSFKLLDGTEILIKDYYSKQHDKTIKDINQPLFIARIRDRGPLKDSIIYLIPELCYLTGITDDMCKDFRVMKELSQHLKQAPDTRYNAINKFITRLKENDASRSLLNEWGLDIADSGQIVNARILPPFRVQLGRNITLENKQDWKSDVKSKTPYRGVEIKNWIIVFGHKDESRAKVFVDTILRCAPPMGIQVNPPKFFPMNNDRILTLLNALETNTTEDTQVVVVVLPGQRSDIYSAIKKFGICDHPMATQVVLSHNLSKPERIRPVVQNILLQIVAKLGGALWKVPVPLQNIMICGLDTYHDKGGKHSVAGFVATIDNEFTKYQSNVVLQEPNTELMVGAYRCISSALNAYYDHNKTLPERVIIYRDGVGEGDFLSVQREIEQFKKACQDYNASYTPQILFIVCVKRINLRYFSSGGRCDNVPPGTVLDNTVTLRNYRDFMIVSQAASQGTLTPTHYVVLLNETNLDIDRIQRITYFLCHMYYNWPGTVRVPAPCVYAHKLAGLVGQYVQKYPHMSMADKLYYL